MSSEPASRLRALRAEAAVTQRELARLAIISRSLISRYETGSSAATDSSAKRIALALGKLLGRPVSEAEVFPEVFGPGGSRA